MIRLSSISGFARLALLPVFLLIAGWAPPPGEMNAAIWMKGFREPADTRPIYLTPLHILYDCATQYDGIMKYDQEKGGKVVILTCLTPRSDRNEGRTGDYILYYKYYLYRLEAPQISYGLIGISTAYKSNPNGIELDTRSVHAHMKSLRDRMLDDPKGDLEVEEGQDAFDIAFRFCDSEKDFKCAQRGPWVSTQKPR